MTDSAVCWRELPSNVAPVALTDENAAFHRTVLDKGALGALTMIYSLSLAV